MTESNGMDGMDRDMLSAYLDGECTAAERAAIEARLASDPEWQAELDETAAARDAVRALPMREVPAGFFEAMTIEDSDDADDAPHRPHTWARRTLSIVAVAAAIGFAFMIATPSHSGPTVTPAIAAMSDAHGATASLENDPAVGIAPVAVPVSLAP
ncbi:MAG TPA: zf-HC2 domain-containing protein [Acidimicrobiia bacterium]|nr:zf-HC2 domain-containing protein [Acidimicrobiia bacterium]